jgi:phosphate uptake regulator
MDRTMETRLHSYLSQSQLLKMAMFVQRAVDYSIKSYELGAPEVQQLFRKYDQEWLNLNRHITDRGRTLVAAGKLAVNGSQKSDSALQIYSALQVTYTAASEIAHSAALVVAREPIPISSQLRSVGSYVNSLVRLCTVALFKEEVQYARKILLNNRGRRWCELMLLQIRCLLTGNPAQARFELAIADALEHIAEQAYEIARAVTLTSPDEDGRLDAACERLYFACGSQKEAPACAGAHLFSGCC